MNSSSLRLPALWSESDRPTPRSWAGAVGMGSVKEEPKLEVFWEESEEVTNELMEEVEIDLT